MNRQSFKNHGFKALAIGFLSTTLMASCSQHMQAQKVTTSPQMTNQVSFLTPQIQREDSFVTSEPGIQIFVRKVHVNSNTNNGRVPILLIHGGGPGKMLGFLLL